MAKPNLRLAESLKVLRRFQDKHGGVVESPDLTETHRSRLVEADHFMRMREGEGEPNAETAIELLNANNGLAHYLLLPLTGKKHQLRVHMAALGIPILNDQIYPQHLSKEEIEGDDYSKPLQLLAEHISFIDPVTGQARTFDSQRSLDAL